MRKLPFPTILGLGLCLVASTAIAEECHPVQSRTGVAERLGPCEYLGDQFEACIDSPITGTLNGTWHYFGPPDAFHVEWNPGPTPPSPFPDYAIIALGWSLAVFESTRGEVWAHDTYALNALAETSDGGRPGVTLARIVGGTGDWEGASGWLGIIFADFSEWRGFIRGEICIP